RKSFWIADKIRNRKSISLTAFAVKLAPETGAIREGFRLRHFGMHTSRQTICGFSFQNFSVPG
ncbi:MAG: hypothetical protein IKW80_09165, partial [Thermoguttaceae bacterium]|nr:hypothetical protein [Thermoguttaceae bacterium]